MLKLPDDFKPNNHRRIKSILFFNSYEVCFVYKIIGTYINTCYKLYSRFQIIILEANANFRIILKHLKI